MHYHCEIVIPPTDNIEGAIESIMAKFDENGNDEEGYRQHAFWDFYSIGGRWAGHKQMAGFDKTKLDEFYAWLKAEGVTVAGFQFGKQELSPASQIPKVDAKWNEMFPSDEFRACPIFRHANSPYGKKIEHSLPGDVLPLWAVPDSLKCSHVIFAKPSFESTSGDYTGPFEAGFMLKESVWNGCNHMPVDWSGTFSDAVSKYAKSLENHKREYKERFTPKEDWLVVTVDYHS